MNTLYEISYKTPNGKTNSGNQSVHDLIISSSFSCYVVAESAEEAQQKSIAFMKNSENINYGEIFELTKLEVKTLPVIA